jgi:hypothetical protein
VSAVGESLRWRGLPERARAALDGRLAGLYGRDSDEAAFDSLPADKQQSLLLFARRLGELGLWDSVERVSNVYGEGGVGIDFEAAEDFSLALDAHQRFTRRFAAHADCDEGFLERGKARAALHVLRPAGSARRWAAHFDLHSPVASPASALRHLFAEKLRGRTPDWREIAGALGREGAGPGGTVSG